jgi:hypothetical protein
LIEDTQSLNGSELTEEYAKIQDLIKNKDIWRKGYEKVKEIIKQT